MTSSEPLHESLHHETQQLCTCREAGADMSAWARRMTAAACTDPGGQRLEDHEPFTSTPSVIAHGGGLAKPTETASRKRLNKNNTDALPKRLHGAIQELGGMGAPP